MTEHIILKYCREGNLERLKEHSNQLNAQYPTGITRPNSYSFSNEASPLYVAVKNRKYDCVKFILSQGVNVNVGMNERHTLGEQSDIGHDEYCTPLYESISMKDVELVKLMLGANPDLSKGFCHESDKGGGYSSDCKTEARNCENREIQKLFEQPLKEGELRCNTCKHVLCGKTNFDFCGKMVGDWLGVSELSCGTRKYKRSPMVACCECKDWKRFSKK